MIKLAILGFLFLGACGTGTPIEISPTDSHKDACNVGQPGTFEADNCGDNVHLLCFTHDGPVTGCFVEHYPTPNVGVWGECVKACP